MIDKRARYGAYINRGRIILHSDLNNFFASCECALNPELRGHPVAVCGDVQARHGIVLAKNELAKKYGVKTAEPIWQAKQKCPCLVLVQANYENYMKYSHMAREIYSEYSDRVESFGEDEAWIDLTGSVFAKNLLDGAKVADEIRNRIFRELGLTASVGVSYNKIFAKLASDYRKPDATTVFTPEDYAGIVANLPASDMLYIGRSTSSTLAGIGVHTIGQLANLTEPFMKTMFGKNGITMLKNARGENTAPVSKNGEEEEIKSIGNSSTPPRDLENEEDVRAMCYMLAESVGARLRHHNLKCNTVQISIREADLKTHEHQVKLEFATNSTVTIANAAISLFRAVYDWHIPIRSIGVRATNLERADTPVQLSIFDDGISKRTKNGKIDNAVDAIRDRYGYSSVQRGILMCDKGLTNSNVKDESNLKGVFKQH